MAVSDFCHSIPPINFISLLFPCSGSCASIKDSGARISICVFQIVYSICETRWLHTKQFESGYPGFWPKIIDVKHNID